jgi:Protein of unknown function (DUF3592)
MTIEDNFMAQNNDKSGKASGCFGWLGWGLGLNLVWVLLAVFAVFLGWHSYRLSINGEVARGTVVRLVDDDLTSSFADIYPVVEFEANGQSYSVRSQNNYRWWNRYTRFRIGRQVEMRYDPENPENAEVNSWVDLWAEPVILGVFVAFCAIGVNAFLFLRWRVWRSGQTGAD